MPLQNKNHISIYTDGGCSNNPGPGGYGVIIEMDGKREEYFGGFRLTTNNRMELTAAIIGLQKITGNKNIRLFSDSRYLVDGMEKGWAKTWQSHRWRKADKSRAVNIDLWQQLLNLCEQHDVKFVWVEGHSGHPQNERCDKLAMKARGQKNLPIDPGYELPSSPQQLGFILEK